MITIKTFTASIDRNIIAELAKLRIQVFRDYPYLYDGNMDYEMQYLQTYLNAPQSIVVVAFDGDQVVGASTALPMGAETDNIKGPRAEKGYDVKKIFYFGESVLLKEYRSQGIGVAFFERREKWARQCGKFELMTFCGVIRPDNHPLKPEHYVPLDTFWHKRSSAYLTKFSRLIRLVLDNSRTETVPLNKELEALQIYVLMEQMRFSDRFDFRLTVGNDIQTEHLEIPQLLICA